MKTGSCIHCWFSETFTLSPSLSMGSWGRVVDSLDFCLALLKSLGCFYFWCILSSQWKAVTVNFTLPTLKAFLEAYRNVSGNKQLTCCSCYMMPQNTFSHHKIVIFWSAKKQCKDTFPPTLHPLCQLLLELQQWWHLYCSAILGSSASILTRCEAMHSP